MKQETDDYLNINKNQIGPAASVTIKTKLFALEEAIEGVYDDLINNKAELEGLQKEKQSQEDTLKKKTEETKVELLQSLNDVEENMKKHLALQKEENIRFQKIITSLKGEKTVLISKLIALQRRVSDMENQMGEPSDII